ncbi:MAG: hypothetical protein Kow00107_03990 [Planctomycetota bacterium]
MSEARKKTFGDIAVAKGYITEEVLEKALIEQKKYQSKGQYPLLGIVLLRMGKITNTQLIEIILEMEKS